MTNQLDPEDYPSDIIDGYQASRVAFISGETIKALQQADASLVGWSNRYYIEVNGKRYESKAIATLGERIS